MSIYHQSVYNNITEYAQASIAGYPAIHSTDDECIEKGPISYSGYYLCNSIYASSVYSCICSVLRQENTRFITIQCCLYILRYILTNHIYGDYLPYEILQQCSLMYPSL